MLNSIKSAVGEFFTAYGSKLLWGANIFLILGLFLSWAQIKFILLAAYFPVSVGIICGLIVTAIYAYYKKNLSDLELMNSYIFISGIIGAIFTVWMLYWPGNADILFEKFTDNPKPAKTVDDARPPDDDDDKKDDGRPPKKKPEPKDDHKGGGGVIRYGNYPANEHRRRLYTPDELGEAQEQLDFVIANEALIRGDIALGQEDMLAAKARCLKVYEQLRNVYQRILRLGTPNFHPYRQETLRELMRLANANMMAYYREIDREEQIGHGNWIPELRAQFTAELDREREYMELFGRTDIEPQDIPAHTNEIYAAMHRIQELFDARPFREAVRLGEEVLEEATLDRLQELIAMARNIGNRWDRTYREWVEENNPPVPEEEEEAPGEVIELTVPQLVTRIVNDATEGAIAAIAADEALEARVLPNMFDDTMAQAATLFHETGPADIIEDVHRAQEAYSQMGELSREAPFAARITAPKMSNTLRQLEDLDYSTEQGLTTAITLVMFPATTAYASDLKTVLTPPQQEFYKILQLMLDGLRNMRRRFAADHTEDPDIADVPGSEFD